MAGNAANAVAGFASGNIVGGIQGTIGVFSGFINLMDEQMKQAEQAEKERIKTGVEQTQRFIESLNRTLEQQDKLLQRAFGVDKINSFNLSIKKTQDALVNTISKIKELDNSGNVNRPRYTSNLTTKNILNLGDQKPAAATTRSWTYTQTDLAGLDLNNIEDVLKANDKAINQLYSDIYNNTVIGDKEKLQELLKEYDSLQDKLFQLKTQMKEAITGTTSDSIAQTISDGFAKGYSSVQDFGTDVNSILKNALMKGFQANILTKEFQKVYDTFANAGENGYTTDELNQLKGDFNTEIGKVQQVWKQLTETAKGAGIDLVDTNNKANQNTLPGAIKGITEQQADLLAGQFGGLRMTAIDILNVCGQQLSTLNKIEKNTGETSSKLGDIYKSIQSNRNSAEYFSRSTGG